MIAAGNDCHPGTILDLMMMTATDGKERTAEEYAELLASGGVELTRVVPRASPISAVEARPA